MTAESSPPPAPRPPLWKNPFAIAFVLGLVVLTALPLLQRPFLKAPPPIHTLAPWHLTTLDGGVVGSEQLRGTVWLAELVPSPCDLACRDRAALFAGDVRHVDDLDGGARLVLLTHPGAVDAVATLPPHRDWLALTGTREALEPLTQQLRAGWWQFAHTDAGATVDDFFRLPAVVLVDQEGAVRGYWRDDVAGRGNSINAARLLTRRGPSP